MFKHVFQIVLILAFVSGSSEVWAQANRPSKRQVETLLGQAVSPLRSCLQRTLQQPPGQNVVVTLEFANEGGFPMPLEISAPPGSPLERCIGEALAELSAPAIPGPPLRVQCQFPIVGQSRVNCRPVQESAPPPPPPPPPPPQQTQQNAQQSRPPANPPPPNPPPANTQTQTQAQNTPPQPPPPPPVMPDQPQAPLSRVEVASAMRGLTPHVQSCASGAGVTPPRTIRLRVSLNGDGTASLVETDPNPPEQIASCLRRVVGNVRVRPTGREPITVSFPFMMIRQ